MLQRCHVVFFKQLSSWVLHGLLKDSLHEFFIQPVQGSGDQSKVSYLVFIFVFVLFSFNVILCGKTILENGHAVFYLFICVDTGV